MYQLWIVLSDFDLLENDITEEQKKQVHEIQEQLKHYLGHQAQKVYFNAQFNATLAQLDSEGALIIADYKMRILSKPACETKRDFFGKRGWALHTILVFRKIESLNNLLEELDKLREKLDKLEKKI